MHMWNQEPSLSVLMLCWNLYMTQILNTKSKELPKYKLKGLQERESFIDVWYELKIQLR